jgi:feruloyl-CoA synthase
LQAYNATTSGSARTIEAFRIMTEPLSMAAGEITDKGSVNQRAVLANRRGAVCGLYEGGCGVIACKT